MDADFWNGKTLLVTGVCGTIGSALLARLAGVPGLSIVGLDNDAPALALLRARHAPGGAVRLIETDVCDRAAVMAAVRGVDYLVHAAAAKWVDRCEADPWYAAEVNVGGLGNVLEAARAAGVAKLLFTSSDKAVAPASAMGATKLLGEKLVAAAARDGAGMVCSTVRFGNVCGSSASVIPLFRRQIAAGGPLTLTDAAMTRFLMGVDDAVELIIGALVAGTGGEIFIPKMPSANIGTIARVMIDALAAGHGHAPDALEIVLIGAAAGEKLDEKLMLDSELAAARDAGPFLVIGGAPAALTVAPGGPLSSSEAPMDYAHTARFLARCGLLAGPGPAR